MTDKDRDLLKHLAKSPQGTALKNLLAEAIDELGDVSKCTSWEDTVGRQHAKNFLVETFRFLEKPDAPVPHKNPYV